MALEEKEDCVRCSTTVYASNEPRDRIISFRITRSLAERIEGYRKQQRKRVTKTEAITELLETGLFVMEKAPKSTRSGNGKILSRKPIQRAISR